MERVTYTHEPFHDYSELVGAPSDSITDSDAPSYASLPSPSISARSRTPDDDPPPRSTQLLSHDVQHEERVAELVKYALATSALLTPSLSDAIPLYPSPDDSRPASRRTRMVWPDNWETRGSWWTHNRWSGSLGRRRAEEDLLKELDEFVKANQAFDVKVAKALTAIRDIECIAHGFGLSKPLPPVSRYEDSIPNDHSLHAQPLRQAIARSLRSSKDAFENAKATSRSLDSVPLPGGFSPASSVLEPPSHVSANQDGSIPRLSTLQELQHAHHATRLTFLWHLLLLHDSPFAILPSLPPLSSLLTSQTALIHSLMDSEGLSPSSPTPGTPRTRPKSRPTSWHIPNSPAPRSRPLSLSLALPLNLAQSSLSRSLPPSFAPPNPNSQLSLEERMQAMSLTLRSLNAKVHVVRRDHSQAVLDGMKHDLDALWRAWEGAKRSLEKGQARERSGSRERAGYEGDMERSFSQEGSSLGSIDDLDEPEPEAPEPLSEDDEASKVVAGPEEEDTFIVPPDLRGREQVFEAIVDPAPRKGRSGLSREERIALAKQRKEDEIATSDATPDGLRGQVGLIEELKDVIGLMKEKSRLSAEL